jgi:hypothetical protein
MEAVTKVLSEQGLAGAFLLVLLLAIGYLQRKRDDDSESRLKDSRETLLTVSEMNRLVGGLKDAVAGLNQNLASLTSTVQTLHSDTRQATEFNRVRDERVERMIESNGEIIRDTQGTVKQAANVLQQSQAILLRCANREGSAG